MRNINYLFTFIGLFAINLLSCDVIEAPFTEEVVVDECVEKCKKIFLENYTGHMCGNCPRAAEKITELKNIFGDQLVVVAVHAGFFAEPTSSYFTNDLRTIAGEEWDSQFGNSEAGNPNGMVNRIGYPESNHILQFSQWAQKIQELLQVKPEVFIQLQTNYDTITRNLTINVDTEILKSTTTPMSINVVLTESKIIGYQKDYEADSEKLPNYQHNHVMRKSLTGPWGKDLGKETYENSDQISNIFNFRLEENWTPENMSVVAFISSTNTLEVIQAQEVPIQK